jgi:hypothetical protein
MNVFNFAQGGRESAKDVEIVRCFDQGGVTLRAQLPTDKLDRYRRQSHQETTHLLRPRSCRSPLIYEGEHVNIPNMCPSKQALLY